MVLHSVNKEVFFFLQLRRVEQLSQMPFAIFFCINQVCKDQGLVFKYVWFSYYLNGVGVLNVKQIHRFEEGLDGLGIQGLDPTFRSYSAY